MLSFVAQRLALRAVKFGAPVSAEAKKVARAARFGETTSVDSKKEARAARFGSSASSVTSAGNVPVSIVHMVTI